MSNPKFASGATLKNNQWSEFGNLSTPRYHHGSITSGSRTMIVGGAGYNLSSYPTEVWNFEAETSKVINPTIPNKNYSVGLGLYVVDKNFCKKK